MRRPLLLALVIVGTHACSGARSPDDQLQLRRTILDVSGHVNVMRSAGAFVDYGEVVDAARAIDPTLVAAEPFVFLEATVCRQERSHSIAIKGMVPDTTLTHDVERYLVAGRMFTAAAPSLEAKHTRVATTQETLGTPCPGECVTDRVAESLLRRTRKLRRPDRRGVISRASRR